MLDKILELLKEKRAVFLTGGGGVGKSYLTCQIIEHYEKNKKAVIALGSTGISAVNIGGITIHSFFRFGISADLHELAILDKKQSKKLEELYEIIENIDLLIIDEISMVSADLFNMIFYRLRKAGFDGALLLVGDFYQLAPVQKDLNSLNPTTQFLQQQELFSPNIYAFSSHSWDIIKPKNVLLTHSKRTDDLEFYELLNELRVGILSQKCFDFLCSRLINQNNQPPKDVLMLFGVNKKADAVNKSRLNAINAPLYRLEAKIEILDEKLDDKAISKWIQSISLPQILELKVGAEVMFCMNKHGSFYNGERGVVTEINNEIIKVAKKNGIVVEVSQIMLDLKEYVSNGDEIESVQRAKFIQYPLRLAYAITIHKSQGMSLDEFVCDIDDIFARGQLYVALSRATKANGLFLHFSKRNLAWHLQKSLACDNDVIKFYEKAEFIKEE